MNKQEIIDKYPLFEEQSMQVCLNSILQLDGRDDLTDDRAYLTEFCVDRSDENDDLFYSEMIIALQYILSNKTAYTTPDKIICMNYPNTEIVPMDSNKFMRWYFVYCHECLHQLWDTFDVASEIEQTYGECDYQLLNIASDCVINDFLTYVNKANKKPPIEGITNEYIEETFGVKYDRKFDTQFTLYEKLLNELTDDQKNKLKQQNQNDQEVHGGQKTQGGKSNGEQSKSNGGQGNGQASSSDCANSANDVAKAAKEIADKASEASEKSGKQEDKDAAQKAQDAAQRSQDAADAAKKCAENGDDEGTAENTVKAANAAQEAINEAKKVLKDSEEGKQLKSNDPNSKDPNSKGNGSNGSDDKKSSEKSVSDKLNDAKKIADNVFKNSGKSSSGSKEAGNEHIEITDSMISEITEKVKKITKKYSNAISGDIGDFVRKCKSSKKLTQSGLRMGGTGKGKPWKENVEITCKKYLKQKLKSKKEYEKTYSRVRRGERAFTKDDFRNGRIITPGRREVKKQIGFDLSVFIDISGSMDHVIDSVFESAYEIVEDLKEKFGKEKIVDKNKVILKSYVFDTKMTELTWGKKCSTGGGTYALDHLIKDIHKNESDSFINIIITDGEFDSYNESDVIKNLLDSEGLYVMVTNNSKGTFDDLENNLKIKTRFKVIYTDNFNLSE